MMSSLRVERRCPPAAMFFQRLKACATMTKLGFWPVSIQRKVENNRTTLMKANANSSSMVASSKKKSRKRRFIVNNNEINAR